MATESELLVIVGRALRKHRDRAGKSTNDPEACAIVGSSRSLKRVEQGVRTRVNFSQVGRLCDYYGAPAEVKYELERLWRLSDAKIWAQPSHAIANSGWDSYMEFERMAVGLDQYESLVPPGLAQTEDFMRMLFEKSSEDPERIPDLIAERLQRQEEFEARLDGNIVWRALLSEAVLRNVCDDTQVNRMLELDEHENVTFRYLPFSGGPYPRMNVPFSVLSLRDHRSPSIVYLESPYEYRFYEKKDAVGLYNQIFEAGVLQAKSLKEFRR
ncbi:Scr1 family TA system antitoxin-like transcriptional regulator [Glycomyces scopariae]